jgi:EAL domain-containing protein (putative c-di-GMP-specific phosphodiesterase class I)
MENSFFFINPKSILASRRIVGAEALIRWIHPLKGMITPDKFIHIAEESGQIIDINRWVLRTACRQKNEWIEAGLNPVSVAVNLSGIPTFQSEYHPNHQRGPWDDK